MSNWHFKIFFLKFSLLLFIKIKNVFSICVGCHPLHAISKTPNYYMVSLKGFFFKPYVRPTGPKRCCSNPFRGGCRNLPLFRKGGENKKLFRRGKIEDLYWTANDFNLKRAEIFKKIQLFDIMTIYHHFSPMIIHISKEITFFLISVVKV